MKPKDFTRDRKINATDIILYNMNNHGKTTKMELYNFIQKVEKEKISSPGFLKQRLKLDPYIFKLINSDLLFDLYNFFQDEVKSYKESYLLLGIDGSDCEVPNTKETRERYKAEKSKKDDIVARIKLSNCFDLLNKRVLDTQVNSYRYSERKLAIKNIEEVSIITGDYTNIYIMDRGYFSIEFIYNLLKAKKMFVIRMCNSDLKKEREKLKSNDEQVDIEYQYDRLRYYKEKNNELYKFYKDGNKINIRIVNIELPTGEIETLATNLSENIFSLDDLDYIYMTRWNSEINYHELKESMKITNISSSKEIIIKQEIYSQMLVYNTIQAVAMDANEEIEQEKYKHKMKINFNMSVGIVKKLLIKIILEPNKKKAEKMYEELYHNFLEYIIPIREGRHYPRKSGKKNKYSINKRKSF